MLVTTWLIRILPALHGFMAVGAVALFASSVNVETVGLQITAAVILIAALTTIVAHIVRTTAGQAPPHDVTTYRVRLFASLADTLLLQAAVSLGPPRVFGVGNTAAVLGGQALAIVVGVPLVVLPMYRVAGERWPA